MDFSEIVEYYGFPVETHEITTPDGYILTNFRIPYGRNANPDDSTRNPVLIIHGIHSSSDTLIMNGVERSIPFYLADNGFDVWMINLRGNYYSRRHTELDPDVDEEEFWDFDFIDHIVDLQVTIQDILQETGFEQISVIGYSHGATVLLVSLATEPEWFNQRVNIGVLYVPLSILSNVLSPTFSFQTDPFIVQTMQTMRLNEVFPKNDMLGRFYQRF
jgi:pimeloyl-ACP methyl ester carboxylesterase